MPSIVLAVPGSVEARTGGYIYDRCMAAALRRRGWSVDVVELDPSFPLPAPAALDRAAAALAAIERGRIVMIDSLAAGAMPDPIEREAARLRLVALMHLPLAAAHGLDRETAARRAAAEGRALRAMALVVVTGQATLPLLAPYGLEPGRVVVVEPGTARPARSSVVSGSRTGADLPLQLLTVATLQGGKGHEILVEALAAVPFRNWRLVCAGSLTRDRATADRVRAAVDRLDLADRVTFAGDLDERGLAACYRRADVVVLPSLQETYGMAAAEALSYGLPLVATRVGALPALVGSEAGVLVPVGDVAALTAALTQVLEDAAFRSRLAEGARRAAERLPTWDAAAERMAAALEGVARAG